MLSVENGLQWLPQLPDETDSAYRFVAGNPLSKWIGGPLTVGGDDLRRILRTNTANLLGLPT